MSRKTFDARWLWTIPRVGAPVPTPDSSAWVVPVTTHDIERNEAITHLWLGGYKLRQITGDAGGSQPAFRPDGGAVAFVRKWTGAGNAQGADKPQLWLNEFDGGEPRRLTDMPLGVSDPRWLPDGSGLLFLAAAHDGHFTPAKTAAEEKRRKASKLKAYSTENRFYRYWDHWIAQGPVLHLWHLDLSTGKLRDLLPTSRRLFPQMDAAGSWDVSPDGREFAFTANRTAEPYHELINGVYRAGMGKGAPKLISGWTTAGASRPRYSPDGRWLVYGAQSELGFYADRVKLVAHELASGKEVVLTPDWDYSPSDWEFADAGTLVLIAEDRGANSIWKVDMARTLRDPAANPPVRVVRGGWFSGLKLAAGKVFTSLQSLTKPPEAATVDLSSGETTTLTRFTTPAMKGWKAPKVREVYFKGAEGHDVQMFVLSPAGAKGRLPLLHLIHGGPHGVFGDQWHWRWCAGLFANAGYLTALVNFHGSTGWGNDFARSILGRWGDQPYDDIMAATDALIAKGWAHPKRLAAAGGSYGGYMVSWIATQTDRFKALVNHAGVSDLQAQFARDVATGREKALGGEPWGNLEGLDRYNPMRHSSGFKSPMLVIHGEQDYRVPYTQALQTYNAYMALKRKARLVVYPDENHWVLKPQNSVHWYGEVLDWLKRWL